jgi:hypothetical protein
MWSAVSWPRADLTVAVTVVLWAGEGETWGYKESPYSRGKKHKGMEQAQTEECNKSQTMSSRESLVSIAVCQYLAASRGTQDL